MKKRLITISAVLLFTLALIPAAFADTTYSAPGDVQAGTELDYLVATVAGTSSVSAEESTLPQGIGLGTEDAARFEGMMDVYLRGTPLKVGSYNCVINITGSNGSNQIICPLSVVPSAPTVTACSAVNCHVGDQAKVSVQAQVSDGGRVSYQWYSNTAQNNTNGKLIEDATEAVLEVSTASVGTTYYYCIVTNTSGDLSTSVTSDIISVTVADVAVASITVETLPRKTEYTVGETLDISGLSIRAKYTNGSNLVVTEGFTVSPTKFDSEGVKNIEVNYQGLSCTFQVTVKAQQEVIDGIGVLTRPDRLDYTVGDTLETKGLTIRVYTNLGYRDVDWTELTCSPMVFNKAGSQTITVSYGGKTCTFTLNIQEMEDPEQLDRIILFSLPSKLQYTVGDTLDTAGLVLTLVSNKGNQQQVNSGFTCDPTRLINVGTTQITVNYQGLTCSFNVNVTAPDFSTPSPSPTAAVETPAVQTPVVQTPGVQTPPVLTPTPVQTPESSSHVIEHQSHQASGSGIFLVLMIAALLGLAALGAYVYIMNHGGVEQVVAEVEELIERIKDRFTKK